MSTTTILSAKDIRIDNQGRCTLAHKSLRQLPFTIIGKKASQIVELDLSNNMLSDLPHLDWFPNLKSLVVDNNRLQSNCNFNNGKPLPTLELLWVNGNQIKHLSLFVDKVAASCPNLRMFSMLKNNACPNFFNGGTMQQYEDYRLFVLSRLRHLEILDSTPVNEIEREEAIKQYGDLNIQPKLAQMRQRKKTGSVSGLALPDVDDIDSTRISDSDLSLPDVDVLQRNSVPDLPDPSQL